MKKLICSLALVLTTLMLTGCTDGNTIITGASAVYAVMAGLSLLLLVSYCYLIQKKDSWFLLLFTLVTIVNVGYFSLSISTTLEEALLANRIAYLGSAFLPMSMLMIILNVTKLRVPRIVPGLLFALGLVVFLLAASPGFSDIYYKEVTLNWVGGVAVLNKVYGPYHSLYAIYLLLYFMAIIAAVAYATLKNLMVSKSHMVILAMAAFVNMGVWLMEQLVKIDFEFLAVSYVISELFLLCLHLMIQESERTTAVGIVGTAETTESTTPQCSATEERKIPEEQPCTAAEFQPEGQDVPVAETPICPASQPSADMLELFRNGLDELTPTERLIYDFYLEDKSTREIMAELNIKENTLKYHNKNLYSKLGVSSRKQLVALARAMEGNSPL